MCKLLRRADAVLIMLRASAPVAIAVVTCCLAQPAWAQGTVSSWGFGPALGNGTLLSDSATPVPVSGLTGVTAIAAGIDHSLAVKSDGTAWAWGEDNSGQLGIGVYTSIVDAPVQISGLSGVTAVSGGYIHSLAVESDGSVWAWGDNSTGQLGAGTIGVGSNVPLQVSGVSGMVAVAAGVTHSVALRSDGTVWTWGDNISGELGIGTNTRFEAPGQVSGLTGVIAIGAGDAYSVALKSDGTVWVWGQNFLGLFGDGTTSSGSNIPVQVNAISGVTAISGGVDHILALMRDGTVWAWGSNFEGQVGNGTTSFVSPTPGQVIGLTGVKAISGGDFHSLALASDGTVWSWGANFLGQLGNGTFNDSDVPVQVSGISGQTAIAAGGLHSLALKAPSPPQLIESLIQAIQSPSLGLRAGATNSLIVKLVAALSYVAAGDNPDAIAVLGAFINEINALVNSGRLSAVSAAPLISAANGIISIL